jgi:uncharacterized membrane protein YedE/YeeE
MKKYSFLLFGAGFGFLLSRAGATTYDYYAKLFLFQDFQLLWIIATAAAVGALGVALLRANNARALFTRKAITFQRKPYKRGLLPGALVFGLGWGLAGACPGTVLAMLGEGKLGALFTITGIVLGTFLYGWRESRAQRALPKVSSQSRIETASS